MKQMHALGALSRRRQINIESVNQSATDLACPKEIEAGPNREKEQRLLPDRSEEKALTLDDLGGSKDMAYQPRKAEK